MMMKEGNTEMHQRILDVLELASKASFEITVKNSEFVVMVNPRNIISFNPNDVKSALTSLEDIEFEADRILEAMRKLDLREERRNSALSKLTPEEREALDLED
jgi:hypothetical protein